MTLQFAPRRGVYIDMRQVGAAEPLSETDLAQFEALDLVYRCTCAVMYNYVPTSGHPGGSISSGRIVAGLLFDGMDYDLSNPERQDADFMVYAAGHKALGMYAMWAIRNEIARMAAPELLPAQRERQLRLEDLLGFRHNPVATTPLFRRFGCKALDGHPTPATPFVKIATGASGVGVAGSVGLAWAAGDVYGAAPPKIHILEGEGGLTPGRVAEAMAAAGTASLGNLVMHVDWNQASIDSNRVCRDGEDAGDYVQWNPMELAYLNDWNVVYVDDGKDFAQVVAGQRVAAALDNGQPTAVVYRTTKGWRYGIEGRASHGAGHKMCSDAYFQAVAPLEDLAQRTLPRCSAAPGRCDGAANVEIAEVCAWDALGVVREALEHQKPLLEAMAGRLRAARGRLDTQARKPRSEAPALDRLYAFAQQNLTIPADMALKAGTKTTLRDELGRLFSHLNRQSGGAVVVSAADLFGSTSVSKIGEGFAPGFFNAKTNPGSRLLPTGGICEDAMSGILAGIGSFGHHIGVGSSYGAFNAALGHISARLHAIGNQARHMVDGEPYRPFVLVCAHAGLKTGEDGPTHADPQALQLLQENFPRGTVLTLTPWDSAEIWPLLAASLNRRPAVLAPFVTRPQETVPDRDAQRLAPAEHAAQGVYRLRTAQGQADGVVVLQESGVTATFVSDALPLLDRTGLNVHVYYIASAELFDMLPAAEQARIFPPEHAAVAMGITGFTLPTMYRFVRSDKGRAATLHPYRRGHYLGSGTAAMVLLEAGLDGVSQFDAVARYVEDTSVKPAV